MEADEGVWSEQQVKTRVDAFLHRRAPTTAERSHYTPEQAAEAVCWKVEDLVHQTAAKNGLDRAAVHRQVVRRMMLASFRLRDRPNDLLTDVLDMAVEYKNSQWSGG